jgi:hypothetical protein
LEIEENNQDVFIQAHGHLSVEGNGRADFGIFVDTKFVGISGEQQAWAVNERFGMALSHTPTWLNLILLTVLGFQELQLRM